MAALREGGARHQGGGGQAGFTLVEMLVSLVLLLLALALAGQLLIESQQALVDSAAEALDNPAPLAVARLRGDVVVASGFFTAPSPGGTGVRLALTGHPAGMVVYEQVGSDLVRRVFDGLGIEVGQGIALRRVGGFQAAAVPGTTLLLVEVRYLVHRGRSSPLPTAPGTRGPTARWQTESLYLLPRGRP